MTEPEVRIPPSEPEADAPIDVDMETGDGVEVIEIPETGAGGVDEDEAAEEVSAETEEKPPPRVTFVDYLKSPIIELLVGASDSPAQTLLAAHQALLIQSPSLQEAISQFGEDQSPRRIDLPDEDLDAVGCFLEYLYTDEYFPRKISDNTLEHDPSTPSIDDSGDQLLKHAKVYTLAEKLGLPALKTLSHSKIHRVASTARGEIAYARYVYANTPRSETTIRRPVASFWGQRSHVLRHQAEDEFKQMCLDFPEFGFDVLCFVLDAKEKMRGGDDAGGGPRSGRKRPRV